MAFYPYLMFNGNCRDAFTRYQQIFGGELTLLRMADVPAEQPAPPPEQADLIMHAALKVNDDLLMASDDPTGSSGPAQRMQVNYEVPDIPEAERVFGALADGGEVTMPLSETFWSPKFGMCVDRFGIPWMINVEASEQATS